MISCGALTNLRLIVADHHRYITRGTQFANLTSVGNAFPGLRFYSDDLNDYSDITVGNAFVDSQGLQLINRVRYDTPVWNGLQLGGNLGEDQFASGSIRYSEELGDFSLSSALTYQNDGFSGSCLVLSGLPTEYHRVMQVVTVMSPPIPRPNTPV